MKETRTKILTVLTCMYLISTTNTYALNIKSMMGGLMSNTKKTKVASITVLTDEEKRERQDREALYEKKREAVKALDILWDEIYRTIEDGREQILDDVEKENEGDIYVIYSRTLRDIQEALLR